MTEKNPPTILKARCSGQHMKRAKGLEVWGEQKGESLGEGRVVFAHQEGGHMECPKSSILECGHRVTFIRIEKSHQTLIPWILYGET